MRVLDFWGDLAMPSKYGLCAIGAAGIFALLLTVLS